MTVTCASNLRQIFIATELYAATNKTFFLPAVGANQSSSTTLPQNLWWGPDTLGQSLGIKKMLPNYDQQLMDRIGKIIRCPASEQDNVSTTSGAFQYTGNYTYNTSLGDYRAMDPTNASYPNYVTWAYFKKKSQVPGNVVVALDVTLAGLSGKDRFNTISALTTSKYAGMPHPKHTANVLFADGGVRLIHAADETATGGAASQLQSWMIVAPSPIGYTATNVWQPKRPLPNF